MPLLNPGQPVPDLELTAIGGESVTLSTLWQDAPTVLAFYRGGACPACNRYLHGLQEKYDEFESAGIRVAAISSDRPELGRETAARHDLSFDVLADPERAAIHAFDVIYNEAEGHAEPAIFVVAPGGTLAYESIVSGPLGRPSVDDGRSPGGRAEPRDCRHATWARAQVGRYRGARGARGGPIPLRPIHDKTDAGGPQVQRRGD